MEVILTESVINLGNLGDVVQVADGYFRNYLGPKKKAIPNNKANQAHFKSQLKTLEARAAVVKQEAEAQAKKLDGMTLEIQARVVANDKIYGSISINQINQLLQNAGITVPKNSIILNQTIRYLGSFQVNIKLHPDIEVTIPLQVISDNPIEMEDREKAQKAMEAEADIDDESTATEAVSNETQQDESSDTDSKT